MSGSGTLFDQEKQMSTDIVEHQVAARDLTPINILQSAISQPDIDPERMKGFMDLYERLRADEAAEEFANALAAFQAKCPRITKRRLLDLGGGKGPMFASLDDIDVIVRPLLVEFGLSVNYSAKMTDDGKMTVVCRLHKGRHVDETEVTLPVPTQMRVNDTQKMGAALSYGKRYALCDALNLIVTDEDTDAGGLIHRISEKEVGIIEDWLSQLEPKEKGPFLKYMGVESVAAIPLADFNKAVDALQRKVKAKR
jgi:hypothetical protein